MRLNRFVFVLPVLCAMFAVQAASAALLQLTPIAPVVDGEDIAHMAAQSTTEKLYTDTRAVGQTFTMGLVDAWLDAITVRNTTNVQGTKVYEVRVGEVSGTNFSEIAKEQATQINSISSGDYMIFQLSTPVLLLAGQTYGFDIAMKSSTTGWQTGGIPYLSSTGNASYADGRAYRSTANGNGTPTFAFINSDKVFHLNLTAAAGPIPEPATATLAALGVVGLLRRRRLAK